MTKTRKNKVPNKETFLKSSQGQTDKELISDGFVVLKGSKAAGLDSSFNDSNFVTLRQNSLTKACLEQRDYLEFPDDYIFSSPSTAASIVLGRNANGFDRMETQRRQDTLRTLNQNEGIIGFCVRAADVRTEVLCF